MLKRNNRRAIAVLVAALAVVVLLLIHGFSSWYVGQNLAVEVAVAEAQECLHLVCDSALEESVEGFIRSAAIEAEPTLDPDERAAMDFANSVRKLQAGQQVNTRFAPKNTRKAAGPLGVEVVDVGLRAVLTAAVPMGPPADDTACRKLEAVMAKWAATGG